jgi:heme/copper-type cytochrome/quinol oxidase subunit 3
MFSCRGEEVRVQCLHSSGYLGFHVIIMSEVLSFEMLLQMFTEIEMFGTNPG